MLEIQTLRVEFALQNIHDGENSKIHSVKTNIWQVHIRMFPALAVYKIANLEMRSL